MIGKGVIREQASLSVVYTVAFTLGIFDAIFDTSLTFHFIG